MATAIIPKSAVRENFNIQFGYGEVPGVPVGLNRVLYALPSGKMTESKEEAELAAQKLDGLIRANIKRNPKRNLH